MTPLTVRGSVRGPRSEAEPLCEAQQPPHRPVTSPVERASWPSGPMQSSPWGPFPYHEGAQTNERQMR
jgi:hypothetical protein